MTDVRGLVFDKTMMADFNSRPSPQTGYDADGTRQRAVAWHPSWGMNEVWVGGDHMNGAFNSGTGRDITEGYRRFWVRNLSEVRDGSKLISFASTRAQDVDGNPSYGGHPGQIDPGHYMAPPPRPHPTGRVQSSYGLGGGWYANVSAGKWDPRQPVNTWGESSDALGHPFGLDFRHFSKSLAITLDGHGDSYSIEQLKDMRRWANKANAPDWNCPPSSPGGGPGF